MERALNDVSEPTDNDDLNSFDLADENQMSEDDIEALLSGDEENELLSDGKVDQSLLDDLLASELDALDDEPAIQDTEPWIRYSMMSWRRSVKRIMTNLISVVQA